MKLCLIGSTRFHRAFHAWDWLLTTHGHLIYSICGGQRNENSGKPDSDIKVMLDAVHKRKILESEAVVLIDCARIPPSSPVEVKHETYIGDSTRSELCFAKVMHRNVYKTSSGAADYLLESYSEEMRGGFVA